MMKSILCSLIGINLFIVQEIQAQYLNAERTQRNEVITAIRDSSTRIRFEQLTEYVPGGGLVYREDVDGINRIIKLNNPSINRYIVRNDFLNIASLYFTEYDRTSPSSYSDKHCKNSDMISMDFLCRSFEYVKASKKYYRKDFENEPRITPNGDTIPAPPIILSEPILLESDVFLHLLMCYYDLEPDIEGVWPPEKQYIFTDDLPIVIENILKKAEEKYSDNAFALRQIDEFRRYVKSY